MVDFLDELLEDDEYDDEDGTGTLPTREDIGSLREEIDALNKEKHGLLQGVKEERRRRQEISGRLNQLTETVNSILTQRQNPVAGAVAEAGRNPGSDGLPVTWTEDGEGFIPKDTLSKELEPYMNKINRLEQMLQLTTAQTSAEKEAEKVRQAIVGEDERYAPAYGKYQAARKWVVDAVTDFVQTNGINRPLNSGEALDYVFDKDAEAEFEAAFPGLSLEDVVTAEDSKRHFRRTMANLAKALSPSDDRNAPARRIDGRFQQILQKPVGLGQSANAKGANLSITEKVGSLKPVDFMDLTDAQEAALLKALASEEKNGIEF